MNKYTRDQIQHAWDLSLVKGFVGDRKMGFVVTNFLYMLGRESLHHAKVAKLIRRLKLKRSNDNVYIGMRCVYFVYNGSPKMGGAIDNTIHKLGVKNLDLEFIARSLKRFKWIRFKVATKQDRCKKEKGRLLVKARSLSAGWSHVK